MKNKTFIHKSADVSKKAKIGKNVKIWHQAQIREGAVIGDNCIIGKGVYIDHDVTIGNQVKIQNYACIYYPSEIEDNVFIGPFTCLTNDPFPRAIGEDGKLKKEGQWQTKKTIIKKGASLASGVIVLPGVRVGSEALVGAGSVVTKNIKRGILAHGSPARKKKCIKTDR